MVTQFKFDKSICNMPLYNASTASKETRCVKFFINNPEKCTVRGSLEGALLGPSKSSVLLSLMVLAYGTGFTVWGQHIYYGAYDY